MFVPPWNSSFKFSTVSWFGAEYCYARKLFVCNSHDFSYVNHLSHSIFKGDFNTHSPIWGYSGPNEAGRIVQDFLSSTTFELILYSRKKILTQICVTMAEAPPQTC